MNAQGDGAKDERGAGTILTASAALVLLIVTTTAAVLASWLAQAVRLQDVADLSAAAGASAMAAGEKACPAARLTAKRNGSEVTQCLVRGDARAFVVEVAVENDLKPSVPSLTSTLSRQAAAGTIGSHTGSV